MRTSCGISSVAGAVVAGRRASARRLWFRVRVLTEGRTYLGRLRLERARTALHDLIGDDRAYLALWDATEEGIPGDPGFVAIHKSTIRAVVLLGDAAAPAAAE